MTRYVNMIDSFLSGWGLAQGGKSIYCVECDTQEQADAIERAASYRPEMKYVAQANTPRRARSERDHVDIAHVSTLGGPWLEFMPQAMAKRKRLKLT